MLLFEDAPAEAKGRPIHLSGYERESRDFYATPPAVTEALLRHITLRGRVWEPCCGDGAMSRVLEARGYDVLSTDLVDRGFGTTGVDFLKTSVVPGGCASIVTNPPYGNTTSDREQSRSPLAMLNFVKHALALTDSVQGQLALLVRLQWIAGKRVADVLSAAPFSAVIVLTKRIQWYNFGTHTNQSQHHHAWVVFDHQHPKGRPPALLYV